MATPHENLTRDEAVARARLLSDLRYRVHLDLTGDDETFGCETTVTFACRSDNASTFIDCTAEEVHEVVLNGRTLDRDRIRETRILLDGLAGENELTVRATMAYRHEGKGLHFFRDPVDDRAYLHSQHEPFDAHLVFPSFDQPDLKGVFELAVEGREEWVVVSNMEAVERPGDGAAGTWRFAPTPVIPTYITAVVAGSYTGATDRHRGIDLGLYIRRSLADHIDAEELFEITKQGLDWFEQAFAMEYPFGKYDQLFVPEFHAGAMENPGCVTFSEAYVFRSKVTDAARERRAETVLHEMAHMWFGDLVTMRWWDDLWLNESFATFMAVLSQSEATRFTNAWVTFLDSEKTWAKFQDQLPTTHPVAADMPDIESVHQNFDGITYAKGASVLRQLVAWVGQTEFLEGCRRYFDKHAFDNAELADFLSVLEDASGRDLGAWRDEWLTTTGVNTLAAEYAIEPDGAFSSFLVRQSADDDHPTLRRHRVAIGVYGDRDGKLVRTRRVEFDVRGETTSLTDLIGEDAGELVLVNDDDLTYSKVRLDERTMSVVTERLADLADPLPRALVWSAAWDMVRDAELPARRFARLVMNNVESETDVGVLQRLLGRAVACADRYGDPANRDRLLADLAQTARAALERAEPGSDHQLAWARHWAGVARAGDQLDDVRRLLDGELTIDGLDVDTELRWRLVQSLAAAGAADERRIATELERDPTDLGERHAATARAARPTPEAKDAAWRRLLDEPSLSHTMARQLWGGFSQLHQSEALEGYDQRYFDALDDVFATRQIDWAIEFTQGMFPYALASEELLERTDAALEREDLGGPRRRALLEARDTLRRTLAARARDVEA